MGALESKLSPPDLLLVERHADPDDHRVVRLQLTRSGKKRLDALSATHLEELSRVRTRFQSLWNHLPEPAR